MASFLAFQSSFPVQLFILCEGRMYGCKGPQVWHASPKAFLHISGSNYNPVCHGLTSLFITSQYDCIVCLGAFGGRFDHAMSNVNTLFVSGQIQKKQCYLLSANQLVFLLSAVRFSIFNVPCLVDIATFTSPTNWNRPYFYSMILFSYTVLWFEFQYFILQLLITL